MSYGVREYGTREYGDGMRVITTAVGGGGGAANLVGNDTLTFTETATLGTSLRASDTLTFSGSATLTGGAFLVSDMTQDEAYLRFSGSARLSVEVPVVAPPATVSPVKRVSIIMPDPVIDGRGKPT